MDIRPDKRRDFLRSQIVRRSLTTTGLNPHAMRKRQIRPHHIRSISNGGSVVELESRQPGYATPRIRLGHSGRQHARSRNDVALMASFSIIALLATSQAVDVNVTSNPSWWTYVPVAISALAAIATFLITFVLWRRGATDRAREQASKVFASVHRSTNSDGSITIVARVHNNSEAPIWDVQVRARRDGSTYDAGFDQLLPDLLPSTSEDWTWSVPSQNTAREERYPELIFVDGAERRWRRVGLSLTRA